MTDLIPAPRGLRRHPGAVTLTPGTRILAAPGTEGVADWLHGALRPPTGLPLRVAVEATGDRDAALGGAVGAPEGTAGAPEGTLAAREGTARGLRDPREEPGGHEGGVPSGAHPHIRLRLAPALGPEEYRLHSGADGVLVEGGDAAGVFWGVQTLRQLLGPDAFRRAPVRPGRARTVPCVTVEDGPRFRWRGLLLDVARHFLPTREVLRQIDVMAAHRLNVLHLHLTDDQGWRVEIRRYPRLTGTGSWRPRSRRGHGESRLWDETPHGGHYTQDDLREIVAYAAERHVTVVPEIDLPGHSQAAIAAYPELGNTDVVDTASLGVWDSWGVSRHVLAPAEHVLRFYEGVLEEVLELFPGECVHLGGDECPRDEWRASPAAQARIAELGVGDERGLQAWFTRHFAAWLAARGRRLIGWDEILEGGGLPEGTAVSSWRGYAGGVAAARAGHDVVMCPEQHVYLDYRQDPGPDEPVPIAYVRTLEDVYRFEPVPPGLTPDQRAHVLGTQANLWSEVTETPARVDYQLHPRLAAFAEVAWSPLPAPGERDFADFARRTEAHLARLDALGVAYRPPSGPHPWQRRPGVPGRPLDGPPPNR